MEECTDCTPFCVAALHAAWNSQQRFLGVAWLVPLHVLSVSLLAAVHMRPHAGAHPLHLSCLMTVLGLCSLLSS